MLQWPRFFVWRLTNWNGRKFEDKEPLHPGGYRFDVKAACLSGQLLTYADACAQLERCRADGGAYSLGWYVMPDAGYWFLDIDQAVEWQDGVPVASAVVHEALAALPGCLFEYSSSNHGVHFIGRGQLPHHRVKGKGMPEGVELYSRERGICFGMSGQAMGSADTVARPLWVVEADELDTTVLGGGPLPQWRGPSDDAELIRRMLAAKDAGVLLRGGITTQQLWSGDRAAICRVWPDSTEKDGRCSEADGALAYKLAWWTGCDVARMVRIMWQSGLVREKWSAPGNATYVQRTCVSAAQQVIAEGRGVYVERAPVPVLLPELPVAVAAPELGILDANSGVDAALLVISRAGNITELQEACSTVAGWDDWSAVDRSALAERAKRKSQELGAAIPIAQCRQMLLPAALQGVTGAPDWVADWVYVTGIASYCHVAGGYRTVSSTALHAELSRRSDVPAKANGDKFDVHKLMTEVWNVRVVHELDFNPHKPPVFRSEYGYDVLNTFHGSMPEPEQWDEEPVRIFKEHLWLVANHDQAIYDTLLHWLAHQVQRPGQLIRWAVLLLGKTGTGKTSISNLLNKALGKRNVRISSAASINNKGGFMDWVANGKLLGVLEDFSIAGMDRYQTYEAVKPVISDDFVTITRKGQVELSFDNFANYWANTNKNDALPIEAKDRRWFVQPTEMLNAMVENRAYFERLKEAVSSQSGGQWRAWLASIPLPADWPPHRAPITAAAGAMVATGESDALVEARDWIGDSEVVPMFALSRQLRAVAAMQQWDGGCPKTKQLAAIIGHLGFYKLPERMKINGEATSVYVKHKLLNSDRVFIRQIAEQCINRQRFATGGGLSTNLQPTLSP